MANALVQKTPRLSRHTLLSDLIAGATGAVAGAPQAMGFAIIAGVNPVYGLYTTIVATIVASLTTSSTYMTVVPTNALALVVGTTLIGVEQVDVPGYLFTLTFLVGIFQLGFGLLRLGFLTRFVSNAVMTGFITGAGTLIIMGQLGNLTGYNLDHSLSKLGRFWEWLSNLHHSDLTTTIIGIVVIVVIVLMRKTRFKPLATLIGILLATLIVQIAGLDSVRLVRNVSLIPSGLPGIVLPDVSLISQLWSVALAMAVLACVQSAGLTSTVPNPDGNTPDVTQDFSGQGLGNIVAGFFQGMPAGGSLSRTAVNISAGAKTRLANVFSGVIIALVLLMFGSAIEQVTMTALAAQLIVAAVGLLNYKSINIVWHVGRSARLAMIVTFLSTLLFPLEYSIYIGVVLSLALYIYMSATSIHVHRMVVTEDGHFRDTKLPIKLASCEPTIISVTGNLFFAAVRNLESLLPSPDEAQSPIVILRMRDNDYLGSTGINILNRYREKLKARGGTLILAGISEAVVGQLEDTGMIDSFGQENLFPANDVYFSSTEHALARAQKLLEQSKVENVHG